MAVLQTALRFNEIKWTEDEILGAGKFGKVCGGVRPGLPSRRRGAPDYPEIRVAVKLWKKPPQTETDMRLFMRELEVSIRLQHPALLTILCYSMSPYATVTERMTTDVAKVLVLEGKGLSPQGWNMTKKAIVAAGVAIAMCFMHKQNVIHRDLKTENVMLDSDFYPRVADFGLSKIMSMGEEQVKNALEMTQNVGTPLYMAPELFEDSTDPYTTAVDVYAYGMFMYELCTTAKPFKEKSQETPFKFQQYVIDGQRPTIPPYVPDPFKELMTKCWDKAAEQRPTFQEIVEAISTGQFVFDDTDQQEYEDYLDKLLPTVGGPS
jgi:serine/threonine protein kinase